MKSKAQIKMFETLAILFIFFMLLTFGIIFYGRVQKTTISQETQEIVILNAIQVSERASFLPDVQCSFDNIPVDDCIDVEKVQALSNIYLDNLAYYYNIFGFSEILINQTYPDAGAWVIYSNPTPGSFQRIQLPVSIYHPIQDTYALGFIDVRVQG